MSATDPLTAREALLEIRRFLASGDLLSVANGAALDEIAKAGLDRTETVNFELSDLLADRLAEAHERLREAVDPEGHLHLDQVREALALPPDLEAMIERRIGPAR